MAYFIFILILTFSGAYSLKSLAEEENQQVRDPNYYSNSYDSQDSQDSQDSIDYERERKLSIVVKKGIQAQKRKDYNQAIYFYSEAIKLEPNSSDLFFNRGLAKSEAGYPEDAQRDFSQAIKLNPENDAAIFNRGIVEYEMKLYEKALKDFNKTLSLVPGDAKALYNRALTKYSMNDIKGALADAQKSKKLYMSLGKKVEVSEITNFINSINNYNYNPEMSYPRERVENNYYYNYRPNRNYY